MMEIKFATIVSNSEVKFDGDTIAIPINRHYRNALYAPTIGDRVYFLCQGNVKILEGKVVK